MLIKITRYEDINPRKLMDVYSESNYENTDYFFPDEADKKKAVAQVEEGFLGFLKNEFFVKKEATYFVLEEDNIWVSALRISKADEVYYLEALETMPEKRNKGYGSKLLIAVLEEYKKYGSFRLCDCVSKKNIASLKTHEKCGFKIVADSGYDYLQKEADSHDYGLEFKYF